MALIADLVSIKMADDEDHQLPNVIYPGILEKEELVEWVERFYGEYYFRPKAAWRIVRKSLFDNHERKRLYKEAKDYLSLRAKRKKYVAEQKAGRLAAVPARVHQSRLNWALMSASRFMARC